MRTLPINEALREDDRLGEVTLGEKHVFSLYKGAGDESDLYFLTENGEPNKIYMMISRELWNDVFENER